MKVFKYVLIVALCSMRHLTAQVNYNADTQTNIYGDYFLYGSNTGWHDGWTDEQTAEILIGNPAKNISGAGVNSLRPAMYDYFVEQWGYDIRVNAFKFYQQLGAKNNTIFLNGPTDAHRDRTKYCSSGESGIFANLYEPIWVSTGVINEKNYYAKYVYNVVKTYKSYVKFWEVWNEPDYTGNWSATLTWDKSNPNPCDLTNLLAPIQRYVRMLRITYEVVKSLDPQAFVCVGGVGYSTFLDAVLRNTDNPVDGSVTVDYPRKGGAWFDCMSFHIYPMYDIDKNKRNSDAAVNAIAVRKKEYETVFVKYGYNGTTYPKKEYIITECNIPRKSLQGHIGSDEAQRNFLIKAAVTSQKSDIRALYVYSTAEKTTYNNATDPYDVMGFYQNITSGPYNVTPNSCATAWRTTSTLLKDRRYDKAETDALKLSASVDGAAFYSEKEKDYIYVLWAKLTGDNTETASVTFNFPISMDVKSMTIYSWDKKESSTTGNGINLTGSPVFVKASGTVISITGVTLNKATTTLEAGKSETLMATVVPANATNKAVTWRSSNTNVATVSNGVVTAKAVGMADITVETADAGKTAVCKVTVTAPAKISVTGVSLNKTSMSLVVGKTEILTASVVPTNATDRTVTWSSSNTNVATVSNGVVTTKAAGSATITVKTTDGNKTAACTVTVTASPIAVTGVTLNKQTTNLVVGTTETLVASVAPTNATNKAVTWSSSNTNIVTVSNGVVTAKAVGSATVTVKMTDGNKTASCLVTVTASSVAVTSVTLNKQAISLIAGKTETLVASVAPTGATNKAVTWNSNNANVAAVDNTGKITAKNVGTAIIIVKTADGGKTATCTVTVSSVTGIEEPQTVTVTAYPNPTTGKFFLNFGEEGIYNISIVNTAGRVLLRKTVSAGEKEMDISSCPQGIYLVVIDNGKRRTTIKIIKQ